MADTFGTMTHSEYQEFSRQLQERGKRLSQMFTDRAREIGEKELGAGRDMAFLAAHNWQGQQWMTPQQNRAARTILWLQSQSWKPGDMVNRILNRAWRRVAQ